MPIDSKKLMIALAMVSLGLLVPQALLAFNTLDEYLEDKVKQRRALQSRILTLETQAIYDRYNTQDCADASKSMVNEVSNSLEVHLGSDAKNIILACRVKITPKVMGYNQNGDAIVKNSANPTPYFYEDGQFVFSMGFTDTPPYTLCYDSKVLRSLFYTESFEANWATEDFFFLEPVEFFCLPTIKVGELQFLQIGVRKI